MGARESSRFEFEYEFERPDAHSDSGSFFDSVSVSFFVSVSVSIFDSVSVSFFDSDSVSVSDHRKSDDDVRPRSKAPAV